MSTMPSPPSSSGRLGLDMVGKSRGSDVCVMVASFGEKGWCGGGEEAREGRDKTCSFVGTKS